MTRRFDDRYPDEYRDAEAGTDAADLSEARVNPFDRFRVSDGTRPRASAQGQGSWTAQQLSKAYRRGWWLRELGSGRSASGVDERAPVPMSASPDLVPVPPTDGSYHHDNSSTPQSTSSSGGLASMHPLSAGPYAAGEASTVRPGARAAAWAAVGPGWTVLEEDDAAASLPVSTSAAAQAYNDGEAAPTAHEHTQVWRAQEEARAEAVRAARAAPIGTGQSVGRRLLIAAIPIAILAIALSWSTKTGVARPSTPGATAQPGVQAALAAIAGTPFMVGPALGLNAGLAQPEAAIVLSDGHLVVADSGNHRVVILGPRGRLLRAIVGAAVPLRRPSALAAGARYIYVLDSERGAIERYTLAGDFVAHVVQSPLLVGAAGLALGPGATLYTTSARDNAVLMYSGQLGRATAQYRVVAGATPPQLRRPTDVAVDAAGALVILDSGNNRIVELGPGGRFVHQWRAPASGPLHPGHLAILADGRPVASDPTGALLTYPTGDKMPTRHPLVGAPLTHLGALQTLGLSPAPGLGLLVTDREGNQIFRLPAPPPCTQPGCTASSSTQQRADS